MEQSTIESIANSLTLPNVFKEYSSIFKKHDFCDSIIIALHDDLNKTVPCRYVQMYGNYIGMSSIFQDYPIQLVWEDPICRCFHNNEVIVLTEDDALKDPHYSLSVKDRFTRWDIKDMFCSPLTRIDEETYEEIIFGVIIGFNHQNTLMDLDKINVFKKSTDSLSPQLHDAHKLALFKSREKIVNNRLEERKELLKLATELGSLKNEQEVYAHSTEKVLKLNQQFDLCSITIYNKEDDTLSLRATSIKDDSFEDIKEMYLHIFGAVKQKPISTSGACATAFEKKQAFIIEDSQTILNTMQMSPVDRLGVDKLGCRSVLQIPILTVDREENSETKALGVITLMTFKHIAEIKPEEIGNLEKLCTFLGTGIVNAQLYSIVHKERNYDSVTKLFNRRVFDEHVEDIRASKSTNTTVMLLDIDHFKNVNDTYGHSAGNVCLEHFANILRAESREADKIHPYRHGGEEFAIAMPNSTIDHARILAERIRHKTEDSPIEIDGENIYFTVSIGCAQQLNGEDYICTINRADAALYRAKGKGEADESIGRNRVVCDEPTPSKKV